MFCKPDLDYDKNGKPMKLINKQPENPILDSFKNWILLHIENGDFARWFEGLANDTLNVQDVWNKLPKKDKTAWENLRLALLQEQGFLCAYCCCKIDMKEVKEEDQIITYQITVEHWRAKEKAYEKMFDYTNLLACDKLCNQNRGRELLTINPLNTEHIEQINLEISKTEKGNYRISLESQNTDIEQDIKKVLKLNRDDICLKRGKMIKDIDEYAAFYFSTIEQDIPKTDLEHEFCLPDSNGHYRAFSFVAEWYIQTLK